MPEMTVDSPGEVDQCLQRDADQLMVDRRGEIEAGQLGFRPRQRPGLNRAILRGGTLRRNAERRCAQSGNRRSARRGRHHSAASVARRLLSIWSIAETTASKVSIVEAWRAL